ncbi:predicted protein [Nematostella vectensis]|uniref:CTCK domain-containing protein n=1 Tax=Nematostella vectensis TaxID=45351 RepID=A7SFH8_NEMVE|nr:predicted protein [Nematostella vectensis]|eukprot:XP_001629625.1 predicted protein [Nematostella vectensis]
MVARNLARLRYLREDGYEFFNNIEDIKGMYRKLGRRNGGSVGSFSWEFLVVLNARRADLIDVLVSLPNLCCRSFVPKGKKQMTGTDPNHVDHFSLSSDAFNARVLKIKMGGVSPIYGTLVVALLVIISEMSAEANYKEVCQPRQGSVDVRLTGCPEGKAFLHLCVGTCYTEDNVVRDEASCTCCKPTKFRSVQVDVECRHNKAWGIVKHVMREHEHCACVPCLG